MGHSVCRITGEILYTGRFCCAHLYLYVRVYIFAENTTLFSVTDLQYGDLMHGAIYFWVDVGAKVT